MKFTMRYGIDAPFWVAFLLIISLIFTSLGIIGSVHLFVFLYGLICLTIGLWMFLYSTMIKIKHAEVILDLAQVKLDDNLLDVGTGRGLLAITAAKRGCSVKAIDTWSKWDLGGNHKRKLQKNIALAGIQKLDILNADVREMPFSKEQFDVVVSNFVIHNIKDKKGRTKAIKEMWRVLKPGGQLLISDIKYTAEYEQLLNAFTNQIKIKRFFYTFPFSKVIIAHKK